MMCDVIGEFVFFKQKTAYEMRISDWSSDVCSSDLLDQGVKGVEYVDGDPANGALITIENLDQMALPVPLLITESNGRKHTLKLPVEIWQRGGEIGRASCRERVCQ